MPDLTQDIASEEADEHELAVAEQEISYVIKYTVRDAFWVTVQSNCLTAVDKPSLLNFFTKLLISKLLLALFRHSVACVKNANAMNPINNITFFIRFI